ncbi:MAG: FecR domain-containing protein, partial [Pseudomonadota bacterium]
EFELWRDADPRHAAALANAEELWRRTSDDRFSSAFSEVAPSMAQRDATTTVPANDDGHSPSQYSNGWSARAVAACIAAALLIGVFGFAGYRLPPSLKGSSDIEATVFRTTKDSTKRITLTDGSRLVLDAASELTWREDDKMRLAELRSGNALFEVRSDANSPFIVDAGAAQVTVTGTKFDIRRVDGQATISVLEGSVAVSATESSTIGTVSLSAGQAIEVTEAGLGSVQSVFAGEFASWRRGQFVYADATLAEILADANRYAEKPLEVGPRAASLTVTGSFQVKDEELLIAQITEVLPVRLRENDSRRVIELVDR